MINVGMGILTKWFQCIVPPASTDIELVTLLQQNIKALRNLRKEAEKFGDLEDDFDDECLTWLHVIEKVSFKYIKVSLHAPDHFQRVVFRVLTQIESRSAVRYTHIDFDTYSFPECQ